MELQICNKKIYIKKDGLNGKSSLKYVKIVNKKLISKNNKKLKAKW